MKVYAKLAKLPVFSIEDVKNIVGKEKTAYSQLDRLIKQGMVKKIRKNIYSVINPTTGEIVASRYQIGCAITNTAYISHHSAFEFYGLVNQVFYEFYVSSKTKFNNFEFNNINYKYVSSRIAEGVIKAKNTVGVRITDLERTVIDSIRDFNKIGGLEELLKCLDGINYLDEKKLLLYLNLYNIQGLYQRVGYILNYYRNNMHISKNFIDFCKSKIGKSIRYLTNDSKKENHFNVDWKLMVPEVYFELIDQGGNDVV